MNLFRFDLKEFEKTEKEHRDFAHGLNPIRLMALFEGLKDGRLYLDEQIALGKKPALPTLWTEYFLVQMLCDYEAKADRFKRLAKAVIKKPTGKRTNDKLNRSR